MRIVAEKDVVTAITGNGAFIRLLQIETILIDVIDVLGSRHHLVQEFPALNILAVVTLLRVFAVVEVIAATVLQIVTLRRPKCMPSFQLTTTQHASLIRRMRSGVDRCKTDPVFIGGQLLILETVLLIA